MGRLTLLAVSLALLLASSTKAQQGLQPVSTNTADGSDNSTSYTSTQAAAQPPMSPREILEMRGDILMARKEFATAVGAYSQILATEPKNAEIMNKIGVAYQQLGDLDRSGHFYKRAMSADKKFASAINNYGTVEYEKKRYGKAIGLYKKAIVLRPETASLYSNLGYAYFCNKEYPQALTTFEKALTLDPTVFDRKPSGGTIVQQRSTPDPGLFYFMVAKSYARRGDVERTAHYLKLARDDGYANILSAKTDPAFAKVIKEPTVVEVLNVAPAYASASKKTTQN